MLFGNKSEERLKPTSQGATKKEIERLLNLCDVKLRKDRIGRYLKHHAESFVFDEFSESYLLKMGKGLSEILEKVPVPLKAEDFESFNGGSGISVNELGENMSWIIGIDPRFKYTKNYVDFLGRRFKGKWAPEITEKARKAAESNEIEKACILFRAALCLDPFALDAMYGYARACKELYANSDDENYIGSFKAESMERFELITEIYPKFGMAYYYLGYAYLNMGLHVKADIAWREFLERKPKREDMKEINERLQQIAAPVEIECGCNMVLTGSFKRGLKTLEPFMETNFKTWWPLSYYLGVCYARLGRKDEAVISFKNVLTLNASHLETIGELADIYAAVGDEENETKYRKKAELIRNNEQN